MKIIYLCEDCEKEHKHGDEYALPVCNFPRMRVCGYCGSTKYPDQFEPDKKWIPAFKNMQIFIAFNNIYVGKEFSQKPDFFSDFWGDMKKQLFNCLL